MQRGANYLRKERDTYNTPYIVGRTLLRLRHFRPTILDPCCGSGNLLVEFDRMGYTGIGFDIAPWVGPSVDFLTDELPNICPTAHFDIVTNPPFGTQGRLAVSFIERSLELVRPWGGKVYMLLAIDFDSGKTRRHIFGNHPAWFEKIVLHDRIVWFPKEGERVNPAQNWAWFGWDWSRPSGAKPTIDYAGWG